MEGYLYKYNLCGFNSNFKRKRKRFQKKEAVLERLAGRKHRLLQVKM